MKIPAEKITASRVAAWFGLDAPNRAALTQCEILALLLDGIRAAHEDLRKSVHVQSRTLDARKSEKAGDLFLAILEKRIGSLRHVMRKISSQDAAPSVHALFAAQIETLTRVIKTIEGSRQIWGLGGSGDHKRTRWHDVARYADSFGSEALRLSGHAVTSKGAQSHLVKAIQTLLSNGFGLHEERSAIATVLRDRRSWGRTSRARQKTTRKF